MAATLAVLLFSIALLAIPITLRFALNSDKTRQNDISLLWAFGLVRVRIPTEEPEKPSADAMTRETKRKPRKRRSSRRGPGFVQLLSSTRLRRRMVRFVRDIWRAIRKEGISLQVRLGLGDPAETGQLWAVVGPIAGMLAAAQQASIRIEPDFVETVFEYETSGRIQLMPLQLLSLVAALMLSPAVWRAMSRMRVAS